MKWPIEDDIGYLSLHQEEIDRGVVVRLEVVECGGLNPPPVGEHKWTISRNKVEREQGVPIREGDGRVRTIAASVHPDGAITIRSMAYATTIPAEDLELLARLSRAAITGELEPEDKVESPF